MEISNNVQQINFDLDYNKISQSAVADWLLNRKKFVYYSDVSVTVNGITLDTVGCETKEDIVNKNKDAFEQIGITPFDVQKIDNGKYGIINIDNVGSVNTFECNTIEDFEKKNAEVLSKLDDNLRNEIILNVKSLMGINDKEVSFIEIQVDDNSNYIKVFNELMKAKRENSADVSCKKGDDVLNTENCNKVTDLLVKYSNQYLLEYEAKRNELCNKDGVAEAIENFKRVSELASGYEDVTAEYNRVFDTYNSVNFNKADEVLNWLTELTPYVNNENIAMDTNKILGVLAEHEYVKTDVTKLTYLPITENSSVNDMNDLYKELVKYEATDLIYKGFFATQFADSYEEKLEKGEVVAEEEKEAIVETQVTEDFTKELVALEQRKVDIGKGKYLVRKYISGEFNYGSTTFGESFDSKIEKLNKQIVELENAPLTDEPSDINLEFSKAVKKLEEVTYKPGRFSTEEEIKTMKLYYAAAAFPSTDNIIKALESAYVLNQSNEIREPLIETLLKMDVRYASNKDEDDVVAMNATLNKLNLEPFTASSNESKINKLKTEIAEIEKTRAQRIECEEKILDDLLEQESEVNARIEEINNNMKDSPKEEIVKDEPAEEDLGDIVKPVSDNQVSAPTTAYQSKLAAVADEERIFNDESRVNESERWMEQNTAKYTENYNNNEDFTLKAETKEQQKVKDSLVLPHPIKAIKKAATKLVNKIRSAEFGKRIKEALETLREHRVATTIALTAALIGTMGVLGAGMNSVKAQPLSDSKVMESTDTNETVQETVTTQPEVTPEVEPSQEVASTPVVEEQEQTFEQDLQETLNAVMGGDTKVYVSADRAAKEVEGKTATNIQGSWANSVPGAFYEMENGQAEKITAEQAAQNWAEGETVVARMDNERGTAGYMAVEQEDTTGKTR